MLFIDELHTVVGAGAAEGAMDASNMLKPMLARGELHCIGATTLDEYRKYIEKDAALERRFQPVLVAEPSVEDTISILRGLKERYEVHHGVRIQDSACIAAATLSHRYIADRFLPDKAIDLIDESASRLRMEIDSKPEELDRIDREIMQLEIEREALKQGKGQGQQGAPGRPGKRAGRPARSRATPCRPAGTAKSRPSRTCSRPRNRSSRCAPRSSRRSAARTMRAPPSCSMARWPNWSSSRPSRRRACKRCRTASHLLKEEVDAEDIARVVANWTGIPVSKLLEGEVEKLLQMEERLHQRVVGQDEAIRVVSNAVRRARAGLQDPNRPMGSFIFLGPTGVGKTELARALAEFLFDDEDAMVRIDMSEYQERHTVARLIGAPPGYVGYEEGGQLTEAVRRRPYAVVLLDEIEKAHPEVFNVLLQFLDDGRLTDGHGRTVDFKNTVVIMTSNVGSQWIRDLAGDEEAIRERVMEALQAQFRPEFLNRIDEVIIFHSLTREHLVQIVDIQIEHLRAPAGRAQHRHRAEPRRPSTNWPHDGYDPAYGARPLKRVIQRQLQDPLALAILEGRFSRGDTVYVDVRGRTNS